MVLVRKTELACRHGWDHDLWEPREGGGAGGSGSATSSNGRSRSARPPSNGRIPSSATGTDAIVDLHGRGSSERPAEQARRDAPGDGPATRQGPDQQHSDEGQFSHPQNSAEYVSEGVDQLQAETVAYHSAARKDDWQSQLQSYRERERTQFEPVPRPSVLAEDEPSQVESRADSAGANSNGASNGYQPEEFRKVRQSGVTEPFEVESEAPETFGVPEVEEHAEAQHSSATEEDEANAPVQLPMLQASNACCRNCRDFLPAKTGHGGWCNNPFAFEQRQSVSGDKVACQGSFGSWWSPSDDWWMERADIAHHSAPTPLIDNLIRQIRSRQIEEEGSTEGQYRS
jgi:hypothetical protein